VDDKSSAVVVINSVGIIQMVNKVGRRLKRHFQARGWLGWSVCALLGLKVHRASRATLLSDNRPTRRRPCPCRGP
jgi:hypothetical protein